VRRSSLEPSHTVQQLLEHNDVRITMIYTHVLNTPGLAVVSPGDTLMEEPMLRYDPVARLHIFLFSQRVTVEGR
jgi:hypothetical protein